MNDTPRALGADPDWRYCPPSYGWWLQLRDKIGVKELA